MSPATMDSWLSMLWDLASGEFLGLNDEILGIQRKYLLIVAYLVILFPCMHIWAVHVNKCWYTACQVVPTLAVVEDVSLPHNEKTGLDGIGKPTTMTCDGSNEKTAQTDIESGERPQSPTRTPKTSNAIAAYLMFGDHGHPDRGSWWWTSYMWVSNLMFLAFAVRDWMGWLPCPVYTYHASRVLYPLLLCQLYTYWRHSVISTSMGGKVYGRQGTGFAFNPACVIGLWRTLTATGLPLIVYGAALQLAMIGSARMAFKMTGSVTDQTGYQGVWATLVETNYTVVLVSVATWAVLYAILAVPSLVVLIRVQASMRPDGETTVVPFDRTFGKDEVWDRGYLTAWEAFRSVSLSSWKRIYLVFLEAYAFSFCDALFSLSCILIHFIVVWGLLLLLNWL